MRALDSLEDRQNKVLSRIEDLQRAVIAKGEALGLTQDDLQCLAEVTGEYCVSECTYQ